MSQQSRRQGVSISWSCPRLRAANCRAFAGSPPREERRPYESHARNHRGYSDGDCRNGATLLVGLTAATVYTSASLARCDPRTLRYLCIEILMVRRIHIPGAGVKKWRTGRLPLLGRIADRQRRRTNVTNRTYSTRRGAQTIRIGVNMRLK